MRLINRILFLIISVFFLISCQESGNENAIVIDSFSQKSTIASLDEMFEKESRKDLGSLDFLLNVSEVSSLQHVEGGGYLYVNRSEGNITLMAEDGDIETYISKRGRGTGEYEDIRTAFMKDNFIYVLQPSKLLVYTRDGEFIRSTEIDPSIVSLAPDGDDFFALEVSDSNNIIKSNASFTSGVHLTEVSGIMSNNLEPFFYQIDYSHDYLFSSTFGNELLHVSETGVNNKYVIDFKGHSWSPDAVNDAAFNYDYEPIAEQMYGSTIYYLNSALENDNYLFLCLTKLDKGEESGYAYWSIDKGSMQSRIYYMEPDDETWSRLTYPLCLNHDNQVIFISADDGANSSPAIVKQTLKSF